MANPPRLEIAADQSSAQPMLDLVVIGGGINGVGVARDAAGRGLSVLLCEQDDLAAHTSSSSTKLIHGGLRYLEYYDFKLVRHALKEREILLRSAPHIIWPLRFVLPHHRELRPRWLIRLGLFIYDHIGGRKRLPASNALDLSSHPAGAALKTQFKRGFEYSDCWVQDSRLVVLNAKQAAEHDASIRVRTQCVDLQATDDHWLVTLRARDSEQTEVIRARSVVNASGPWVEDTAAMQQRSEPSHGVRLVKGSHIVVKKLFDHNYTYIFQNGDGRVLFAVPYEHEYTLLGTTDIEIQGDPGKVKIEPDEIDYICTAVSEYFATPVTAADVVWCYSGVRPLYDDASANASHVTRDYVIHMNDSGPPLISIYGGKITTYRKLSEEVVDMLLPRLNVHAPAWTESATLPGGDIPNADFASFEQSLLQQYRDLPASVVRDYARNYGSLSHVLLAGVGCEDDLGECFGGGLYEAEVRYLVAHEWARSENDILWRRSRKGLRIGDAGRQRLREWTEAKLAKAA